MKTTHFETIKNWNKKIQSLHYCNNSNTSDGRVCGNSNDPWISPALYQSFRLLLVLWWDVSLADFGFRPQQHPFIATAYLSIRHVSIVHLASYFYFQQDRTLYYKPQNSHQISAQSGCAGMGDWMILCQCGPTFMRKIYKFYTNCFVFSVTVVQHSMCVCLSHQWLRISD